MQRQWHGRPEGFAEERVGQTNERTLISRFGHHQTASFQIRAGKRRGREPATATGNRQWFSDCQKLQEMAAASHFECAETARHRLAQTGGDTEAAAPAPDPVVQPEGPGVDGMAVASSRANSTFPSVTHPTSDRAGDAAPPFRRGHLLRARQLSSGDGLELQARQPIVRDAGQSQSVRRSLTAPQGQEHRAPFGQ